MNFTEKELQEALLQHLVKRESSSLSAELVEVKN